MKIILKNFRCYSNQEFDLGNKGMTLISGSKWERKKYYTFRYKLCFIW